MKRVTPPRQKAGLCFNRKTLNLRRGPDLPGDWRTALSRAPADRIGGADALSHPGSLLVLWLLHVGSRRDEPSRMAGGLLRCLSSPPPALQ